MFDMLSTFSVYITNINSKASQQIGEAQDDKINNWYIFIFYEMHKKRR